MWNKPLPPPPRPVVALNPVPPPPFKSPGKWNPIPIQYWKQSQGRFFTVDLARIILDEAKRNDLDPLLIWAVIDQESGFNPAAVSPKGAAGLMQLMPGTAEGLGVSDPFDPAENVRGGVQYLRAQVDRFRDLALALAAYNAGPGAVEEAGGIPGYEETQNYVDSILSRYNDLKGPEGYGYIHFLYDYAKLICYGLESLGHDCSIGPNGLANDRTNIIIGGHLLQTKDDTEYIASVGPYIVRQTEVLWERSMLNFSGNPNQFEEVYLPFLRRAEAVWDVLPSNLPILLSRGVNARLLRSGYHPAMEEVVHKHNKDIDFLFFGTITKHRKIQLEELNLRGHKVITAMGAQPIYRNDLIARTRVHLAPRQETEMTHLPYGRICFVVNNRGLVVAERCLDQEWLEDCFLWSEPEEWVDLCMQALEDPNREEIALQNYERYKKIPMTAEMERVLDGESGVRLSLEPDGETSVMESHLGRSPPP
ncbi:MAG: lytic transglycosylase domain-containing protein [Armatimonadetes bacterium]|nr:lytic transglycosylase domain-containing protein [Armatimonadota bacterium]